jgi:hypothetical protein
MNPENIHPEPSRPAGFLFQFSALSSARSSPGKAFACFSSVAATFEAIMCEKAPTDPRPEIPSAPETAIDFGFDRREAVDEPALDRGLGFGDDRLQKEVAPDHERVVALWEAARPHEMLAFGRLSKE